MNRSARQESPAWSPCRRQEHRGGQSHSLDAAQHRLGSRTRDSRAGSGPTHHQTARSKRHLEGVLKKYTNLFQGWQSRYFVLDPELGQLQYYLNELSKSQRPPRGSLPLLGAMVVSSDEFPFMFTFQSTTGDSYKLRALDAKEQELWMTQLQLCSRRHSDSNAEVMSQAEGQQKNPVTSIETLPPRGGPLFSLDEDLLLLKATSAATLSCLGECLSMLQSNVVQALNQNQNQNHIPCPSLREGSAGSNEAPPAERVKSWGQRRGSGVNQVEPGGLGSRSQSPTHSFSESRSPNHSSLIGRPGSGHKHTQDQNQSQGCAPTADSSTGWSRPPSEKQVKLQTPQSSSTCLPSTQTHQDLDLGSEQGQQQGQTSSPDSLDHNDENTDSEDNEEEDLGVLDDQRSIIIHLLSQLKLGMDLTRVVLPTFILEKRSLLEMYANFMAHPDMFLSITSGCTPEERIIRFVEYYLTAFHEGRKGAVAKKPYNPILGENFHCSWYVPRDRVRPLRTTNCSGPNSAPTATSNPPRSSQRGVDGSRRNSDCYCVRFVAEQVSHHPPVSGFYCECKEKGMCVNTHIWTKSKFMGMSVGVSMVGEGVLYLLEHDEEYVFTLPCAYARSILTVPWVELGGKVTINCAKSGYSATVTFHTKPFYGGKVHRVTAEVKHTHTGNIVCKAQGEWNGVLEFTYNNGENKVIDTSRLPVIKKKIRPLEKQDQYESRRLWQHVTASLKSGNMDAATEHKHCLEERQRSEGKQRAAARVPWKPKYFMKEGEGWVYHNPLWKAQ
ncbi:oxysterol-binding protein-related protein 10-like isoform X1 [Seriola aureovittata]|uniref:oxysterol-binding protein-related protein 10-like isoform X1 n=1 Tax=Seriola aureovittata TaxID=2871759 RepID=UPI0024BE4DA8|nr:oxysterol-binding protein-related protein 10-like isoform X1 [Seriola aureovittata]